MSRRTTKPGLFATLDTAARQAGRIDVDADLLYATSKWAIEQGRRWPWFRVNEARILDEQGGLDNAILCVAGMALARAGQAGDMKVAMQEAGDEYRAMLKRQWDTTESSLRGTHVPFTDLPPDIEPTKFPNPDDEPTQELDPGSFEDPRLRALWPRLTNKQREYLTHLSESSTQTSAAQLMGLTDERRNNTKFGSVGHGYMKRIRERAATLEVE